MAITAPMRAKAMVADFFDQKIYTLNLRDLKFGGVWATDAIDDECKRIAREVFTSPTYGPMALLAFSAHAAPLAHKGVDVKDGSIPDWFAEMPLEGPAGGWIAFCRGLKNVTLRSEDARDIFRSVNTRRANVGSRPAKGGMLVVGKEEEEEMHRLLTAAGQSDSFTVSEFFEALIALAVRASIATKPRSHQVPEALLISDPKRFRHLLEDWLKEQFLPFANSFQHMGTNELDHVLKEARHSGHKDLRKSLKSMEKQCIQLYAKYCEENRPKYAAAGASGVSLKMFVEMTERVGCFAPGGLTFGQMIRLRNAARAAFMVALPLTALHRTSGGMRLLTQENFGRACSRLAFVLIRLLESLRTDDLSNVDLMSPPEVLDSDQLEVVRIALEGALSGAPIPKKRKAIKPVGLAACAATRGFGGTPRAGAPCGATPRTDSLSHRSSDSHRSTDSQRPGDPRKTRQALGPRTKRATPRDAAEGNDANDNSAAGASTASRSLSPPPEDNSGTPRAAMASGNPYLQRTPRRTPRKGTPRSAASGKSPPGGSGASPPQSPVPNLKPQADASSKSPAEISSIAPAGASGKTPADQPNLSGTPRAASKRTPRASGGTPRAGSGGTPRLARVPFADAIASGSTKPPAGSQTTDPAASGSLLEPAPQDVLMKALVTPRAAANAEGDRTSVDA